MAVQQSYMRPNIPFTGCIQGGLYDGKTITISGRVLPGADRFCVNLQCGTNTSSDIALHFNPRYSGNSGHVVCNTRHNSSWASEQQSTYTPLPRGSYFNITFLVNQDSYSVIVNGAHFMEYLHRLPVSGVNVISVDGGVDIESITFHGRSVPVYQGRPIKKVQNSRSRCRMQNVTPVKGAAYQSFAGVNAAPPPYSPPVYLVPYKTIIQGGLYPGRSITIQGCVNHNADMFCINLRYNYGIALHFNPRFSQNVVVRNSLMKECWGNEERSGGLPFYRGQQFTVIITCDTQCYRILLNNIQMFTYNHRHVQLQEIDILEVDGHISISSVTV